MPTRIQSSPESIARPVSDPQLEGWADLSDVEQQGIIKQKLKDLSSDKLKDLSAEDLQKLQEKIESDNAKLLDDILESIDKLHDHRFNKNQKERKKALLDQLNDMRKNLVDYGKELKTVVKDLKKYHVDIDGDQDELNDENIEADNGEYVKNLEAFENPFDDGSSDDDYLVNKGIAELQTINGESIQVAKKDVNRDGLLTEADIKTALEQRHGVSKTVTIKTTKIQYTKISYDETTKQLTLEGKDKDGKTVTIRYNNFSPYDHVDFISGISKEELPMLQALPESLQKMIQWHGQSVHAWLNGEADNIAAPNKELNAIPGYAELISDATFNQVKDMFDSYGSTVTDNEQLKTAYHNALNKLFKAATEKKDMKVVWAEIKDELSQNGFNDRDIAHVVEMVIFATVLKAPKPVDGTKSLFQSFFPASVVEDLSGMIDGFANDYGYSGKDGVALLFLKLHADPTKSQEILNMYAKEQNGQIISGVWGDHEHNIKVLNEYLLMTRQSQMLTPSAVTIEKIIEKETIVKIKPMVGDMPGEDEAAWTQISKNFNHREEYRLAFVQSGAYGYHISLGRPFMDSMTDFMRNEMQNALFDSQGNLVNDPYTVIKQSLERRFHDPKLRAHGLASFLEHLSYSEASRIKEIILRKVAIQARADLRAWPADSNDPARYIIDRVIQMLDSY